LKLEHNQPLTENRRKVVASNPFIDSEIGKMPGWLDRDAAYLTSHLITQQSVVAKGPLVEIGVYGGRYLSVLYEYSKSDPDAAVILGIDVFTDISAAAVSANIHSVCGETKRLRLLQSDSRKLSAENVLAECQEVRPRFISVDGLHTSEGVASDLNLAERVVSTSGIVAVDDFLNPLAIGVSGGLYSYLLVQRGTLVPLLYSSNKLYLCTKESREFYVSIVLKYVHAYTFLPTVQDFNARSVRGPAWTHQEILGKPVLIL
jgi:hypothetical protein